MSRFATLRGRLTALALVAVTVAVVLAIVGFNLALARLLDGQVDRRLRSEAAAAATTIRSSAAGLEVRRSPADAALDAQVWIYEGRQALERPPGPPAVQRAADRLAGRQDAFAGVGDPESRLYAHAVVRRGRQVGTVVAGQSLRAYDRTTDVALTASVALGALLVLAVSAVTWLVIGRALAPVTAMTRSAAEWSEHDPGRRFGAAGLPDELGRLAATFDALLDRVAAGLRREQRLSAELSHELRTPLTRILTEMELLQRHERPAAERAAAYGVVTRSADQMRRILDTLMAAARAEAAPQRGRSALREVLGAVSEGWEETLAERGVRLDVARPADPLPVGVEADLVERIVAPLLDNAGRYARSRVTVDAARADGRVRITVADDGPGLATGEAEAVFEPGARGAGARGAGAEARDRGGHGGAGLGLALARRLARAAGGDVTADADGGPGARFTVDLPG